MYMSAPINQFLTMMIEHFIEPDGWPLTPREGQIIRDVLMGKSFAEVGEAMHLKPMRVKQIWDKALRKLSMSKTMLQKKDEEIKRLQNLLFGAKQSASPNLFDLPLTDCELSVRTINCLKMAGINTVADLVKLNRADLLKFRNFGKKSLTELDEWLDAHGLCFGMDNRCELL